MGTAPAADTDRIALDAAAADGTTAATAPTGAGADTVHADQIIEPDSAWKKTLIVVGNHRLPKDGRKVIVCEERKPNSETGAIEVKMDGYPSGADLYYRTEPDLTFPAGAEVITLGVDVQQGLFWGFSPDRRWVHVGNTIPAYAAANLAWQRGAEEIEIIGLTDSEKANLDWGIKNLSIGGPAPVESAPDVRSPAQVAITLV